MHLSIWDYYDQQCFAPFAMELRKPENTDLLQWARPLAKRHMTRTANTDYTFAGLFYQLLRFPLFSRFLAEDKHGCLINERAARNLAQLSGLLVKYEYLHHINILKNKYRK